MILRGTRVTVTLVPLPGMHKGKTVTGRLRESYRGHGPVEVLRGGNTVIVPAERIFHVAERPTE